ncbi:hypothetical protein B0H14DRAFT_2558671 [Mycena olivaceomarginata]|nr:hypothetical protein B0H14DRAFT_2558671 [Mycena olivaceomarginata]
MQPPTAVEVELCNNLYRRFLGPRRPNTCDRGSDDLDEPGTCRNLGELANVRHCCGRLNIGIGIRACHPQNCQSACPVTEWNEMQLPEVNCWHQQNLQDTQATGSGLSTQWKLHVKSENEEVETISNKITKVLEIRSKAITGLPALLDFHMD